MKFHWKVLLWMVAGVLFGIGLQSTLEVVPYTGGSWAPASGGGLELVAESGPASGGKLSDLSAGDVFSSAVLDRKDRDGTRRLLASGADLQAAAAELGPGELLWLERRGPDGAPSESMVSIRLDLDPDSSLARWIFPFDFAADIFLRLLKMLIVPLVFASIVSGVAGVGTMGDLRRLGGKTFAYYVSTSLLAILVGQLLVNLIQPGKGVELGLAMADPSQEELSFIDILRRMVPENVPAALTDNGAMLQIIFFALLFGIFITKAGPPHDERMRGLFDSLFEVMLRLAEGVLKLLPYGVFALLVRVVAKTGLSVFEPLLIYMLTVVAALVIHCAVTLP
ncbi:MAG: cation:dicarboxylase symporter family transporter, partial [Planctomycetota bacterium]